MMVARANGMAKAGVGVRREVVVQLVEALNAGVHPVVRRLGSVGQGDLSEMADIGKVMIGRGLAEVGDRVLPGDEALAAVGLEPISPAPKEALALVSANGVTLGHGSLVLVDAADLTDSFQIAAALSLEGFAGNLSPIHPAAARMRPHAGEIKASARLRELLEGSHLWEPGAARNLQDPLSFRCVPQTHGALNDALFFARGEMDVELNSASDNPLVVVEDEAIISVGNFDVSALAMAFDLLRLGIASALKVADERVQKLLWNAFSGLPTGLAPQDGPDRRPASAGPLVRRAGRRGSPPGQPGLAGLRGPARRGRRGPRQHGAAVGAQDLGAGVARASDGRPRAHLRRAGDRPAGPRAAGPGHARGLRLRARVRPAPRRRDGLGAGRPAAGRPDRQRRARGARGGRRRRARPARGARGAGRARRPRNERRTSAPP